MVLPLPKEWVLEGGVPGQPSKHPVQTVFVLERDTPTLCEHRRNMTEYTKHSFHFEPVVMFLLRKPFRRYRVQVFIHAVPGCESVSPSHYRWHDKKLLCSGTRMLLRNPVSTTTFTPRFVEDYSFVSRNNRKIIPICSDRAATILRRSFSISTSAKVHRQKAIILLPMDFRRS